VNGVQLTVCPHLLGVPLPPQVSGSVHVPHWTTPPQPSEIGPQSAPAWAQVLGVQMAPPHLLGSPPPPHVCGGVHVPHWMMPPQPSPIGPQLAPTSAHVTGVVQVGASLLSPSVAKPPSSLPLLELLLDALVEGWPPVPPVPPEPGAPPVKPLLVPALQETPITAEERKRTSAQT
jgi:hypothetical protein